MNASGVVKSSVAVGLRRGVITGYESGLIFYSWNWGGVVYSSSQDVHSFEGDDGLRFRHVGGAVSVRFLPDNPQNSIVIAESWSGIRDGAH